MLFFKIECFLGLREHIPLQQGLRPLLAAWTTVVLSALREHIPLQQGLRRFLTPISDTS